MGGKLENAIITREDLSVISHTDSGTDYRYEDRRGHCTISYHRVFPGICCADKEFYGRDRVLRLQTPADHILVIEHCREGRVECGAEEALFHLGAGDAVIRRTDGSIRDIRFPAEHYHGIDIMIDMEKAPRSFGHMFQEVDIALGVLMERLHRSENAFLFFRQDPHMEHIFSELYSAPTSVRQGYRKLKILELLLFLTGMDGMRPAPVKRQLSMGQVRLAEEVRQYLMEHLMERQTIEQLCQRFSVSATRLKDSFRQAYGISIQAFVSEQRMLTAAERLKQTDRKVADVAGEFGYSNASKFAAAFQRVMGDTPAQYRSKQLSRPE